MLLCNYFAEALSRVNEGGIISAVIQEQKLIVVAVQYYILNGFIKTMAVIFQLYITVSHHSIARSLYSRRQWDLWEDSNNCTRVNLVLTLH